MPKNQIRMQGVEVSPAEPAVCDSDEDLCGVERFALKGRLYDLAGGGSSVGDSLVRHGFRGKKWMLTIPEKLHLLLYDIAGHGRMIILY